MPPKMSLAWVFSLALWLMMACGQPPAGDGAPMNVSPAFSGPFQTAVPLPTPAPQIVVGLTTDIASLDPQRITDTMSRVVLDNVYDTLLYRTADLRFEPGLALTWQALDFLTWEVTLRPNVHFHNGDLFTAADVKFTLERPLQDPEYFNATYNRFRVIDHVDIVDDYTVHIITTEPYPLLAARLSEWAMLSHTFVEHVGNEALETRANGTGAYHLIHWEPNGRIVLEANPTYWRGEPAITHAQFVPLPQDDERLFQLVIGRADIITDLSLSHQAEVQKYPNLRYELIPSTYIQYLALDGTKNPILADVRVRQALQYATNVPQIIAQIFQGAARQVAIPVAPGSFGYDETIPPYPYDPARARLLLQEAGYPNGFALTVDAPVGRYPEDRQTVDMIAEQWAAVGVRLTINYNTWATQLALYRSPQGRDLAEAHYMGWGTATFDADDILYNAFAVQPNKSNYTNPQLNTLLQQAHTALNATERQEYYAQALRIIHEEVPWIFLFQQYDIYGVNARVVWEPRPDQKIELRTITLLTNVRDGP